MSKYKSTKVSNVQLPSRVQGRFLKRFFYELKAKSVFQPIPAYLLNTTK